MGSHEKNELLIPRELTPKIERKNDWEVELEQGFLLIITGNSKLLKDSIFSPCQSLLYADIPNFYKSLKGPN